MVHADSMCDTVCEYKEGGGVFNGFKKMKVEI